MNSINVVFLLNGLVLVAVCRRSARTDKRESRGRHKAPTQDWVRPVFHSRREHKGDAVLGVNRKIFRWLCGKMMTANVSGDHSLKRAARSQGRSAEAELRCVRFDASHPARKFVLWVLVAA
jgi:hypothetical protein